MTRIFLLAVFFCLCNILSAVETGLTFKTLSMSDGLPDNTVKCVFEDSNGFVWLGTKNGVARYDGFQYKVLQANPADSNSLADNFVYSITQIDSLAIIAGGANASVSVIYSDFSADASITRQLRAAGATSPVSSLAYKNGYLWIATLGHGLFSYSIEAKTINEYKHDSKGFNSISNNRVSDIIFVGDELYITTESRYVDVLNISTGVFHHRRAFAKNVPFQSFGNQFFMSSDSTIWISTEHNGIVASTNRTGNFKQHPSSLLFPEGYIATDLHVLADSNLIVSFDGAGLLFYKSARNYHWSQSHSQYKNTLPTNAIWTIASSDNGYVWAGTFANGVSFASSKGSAITVFSKQTERGSGLKANSILAMLPRDNSSAFVATDGGGVYVLETETAELNAIASNRPELRVVKSFCNIDSAILCGTYANGIQFLSGTVLESFRGIVDSLRGKSVWSIVADSSNNLWFGTLYNGLYCKTPDSIFHYVAGVGDHGLLSGMVNALYCDANGIVWVGLDGSGAMYFQSGKFHRYDGWEPYKSVVFSITEDRDGCAFIAHKNYGIDRVCRQSGVLYRKEMDLFNSQSVPALFSDSSGIWVAAGNSVMYYTSEGKVRRSWGRKDGFVGEMINPNAMIKSGDYLLVGTVSGLNRIDVTDTGMVVLPEPKVSAISFFRNDREQELSLDGWFLQHNDSIRLQYSDVNLKIRLAYKDEIFFEGVSQFRIHGLVDVWTNVGESGEIVLPFLKGGEYWLELRSVYEHHVGEIYRYRFNVENPFWLKGWFIAGAILLAITVFFLIYAYRDYMHRVQEYKLRKKVEERTRYISKQNTKLAENSKLLEEKNKMLVSQKGKLEQQKQLLDKSYEELNTRNSTLEHQRVELEKVNQLLVRQKEEINEQAIILGDKNKLLTKSLNYAKRIQDSLFPSVDKLDASVPGSFLFFKPKEIVSGDFFWMKEVGNTIVVAEVDCTGHGVPGAFMSMIGNALLNEIVVNRQVLAPSDIFYQMNTELIRIFSLGNFDAEAQDDGMDISIAVIDKETNAVSVASAMQNIFLVKSDETVVYTGDIFSIGGLMARFKSPVYTERKLNVEKGDVLVFASDGFIDQFGGDKKEKFGVDRFVHLLQSACDKNNSSIKSEFLRDQFYAWKGEFTQLDDVLVVGMQF